MPKPLAVPLDKPELTPRPISPKLRSQLVYFASPANAPGTGAETPDPAEYWFDPDNVVRWLADGVFHLVSPLDTANMTEVELTEEQEDFLSWLSAEGVRRVRIDD
jgi:hypothetical protein